MKTILITGANRGLGLAFTKIFLANGWEVYATCRDPHDFPADVNSQNLTVLELDVAQKDSVDKLIVALSGVSLDVLLNNAGVFDSTSTDDKVVPTDPKVLARVFEVNTIAPRLLAEKLLPNLRTGSDKLVLTISSGMGTYASMDDFHAHHWVYSSSKAAVNYAMFAFGLLYPDIRSVLIRPGWVKTQMGGRHAPLEPDFVAQKVCELVTRGNLQNRMFVDYDGKEMKF